MSLKFYPLALAICLALTALIPITNATGPTQLDEPVGSAPTTAPDVCVITWKGSHDNRWSNPRNWDSGYVPGPADVARFTRGSAAEVEVDSKAAGIVGAIVVDA